MCCSYRYPKLIQNRYKMIWLKTCKISLHCIFIQYFPSYFDVISKEWNAKAQHKTCCVNALAEKVDGACALWARPICCAKSATCAWRWLRHLPHAAASRLRNFSKHPLRQNGKSPDRTQGSVGLFLAEKEVCTSRAQHFLRFFALILLYTFLAKKSISCWFLSVVILNDFCRFWNIVFLFIWNVGKLLSKFGIMMAALR